jgi:hypothetical protein
VNLGRENKLKENNQEKRKHHPNKDIVGSNNKCFTDAPLGLRDCQSKVKDLYIDRSSRY